MKNIRKFKRDTSLNPSDARPPLLPPLSVLWTEQLLQLAAVDQRLQIARPTDEGALDEDERKGWPSQPDLQGQPAPPAREVAAVLEVAVGDVLLVEQSSRALAGQQPGDADHDHLLGGDGLRHLLN